MIEIRAIGGYNEIGKNMTAIRVDNTVIILDAGIHLENYIKLTHEEDITKFNYKDLIDAGAIPDISLLDDWKSLVKALIPTHAHLDHVGAIPYIEGRFAAPIIATPFTAEVIKSIMNDEKIKIKNEIKKLNPNSSYALSDDINIEFINATHSTPQTVMIALHTRHGILLYANDFKFDSYQTLGKKPNYKRLKEFGKKNQIHSLIVDSTRANEYRKTPSEAVAKDMLRDVLLATDSENKLIIVSTFSSHIARLKSIVDFAERLGRKVVFMGRSLSKYTEASKNANVIDFSKHEIIKYPRKIKRKFKEIKDDKGRYLLIVTGHQGEPKSVLSRLINGEYNFSLEKEDHVVFSCEVIPTKTNIHNRNVMEHKLKDMKVRIFKDIHVSGHAAREDLRDLLNMLKPRNIIPAHGNLLMTTGLVDLAKEIGFKDKNILLLQNGDSIKLD
jgi:ribonuclease J